MAVAVALLKLLLHLGDDFFLSLRSFYFFCQQLHLLHRFRVFLLVVGSDDFIVAHLGLYDGVDISGWHFLIIEPLGLHLLSVHGNGFFDLGQRLLTDFHQLFVRFLSDKFFIEFFELLHFKGLDSHLMFLRVQDKLEVLKNLLLDSDRDILINESLDIVDLALHSILLISDSLHILCTFVLQFVIFFLLQFFIPQFLHTFHDLDFLFAEIILPFVTFFHV